jgi:hypothetical protein
MIALDLFTYTEQQWDRIKVAVRDALGLDADQIEREITPVIHKSLRSCIEHAVSEYSPAATKRRRAELSALRKNIENQRASHIDAFTVEVDRKGGMFAVMLLPGVDADMVTATNDYFRKLERNLDRQIEQPGQRGGDNARKTARDHCWSELLAIWCDLGGKPRGVAAAEFLWVASKSVMGDAVPSHKSIVQWLERRWRATR